MANAARYADDEAVRQAVSESLRLDMNPDYGDKVVISKHAIGISEASIVSAKTRISEAVRAILAEG